jgi:hypothetical protein
VGLARLLRKPPLIVADRAAPLLISGSSPETPSNALGFQPVVRIADPQRTQGCKNEARDRVSRGDQRSDEAEALREDASLCAQGP